MRKILLSAVAALAVLALPAVASASATWTHEGVPITEHTTLEATGPIQFTFETGAGGFECAIHVSITITESQAASHVPQFECTEARTFGAMKEVFGCSVEGIHAEVPFTAMPTPTPTKTPTPKMIDITNISMITTMNPGCLVGEEILIFSGAEPVTATPDNAEAMSSLQMGGEIEANIGALEVEGTLAVSPAGTYGIE